MPAVHSLGFLVLSNLVLYALYYIYWCVNQVPISFESVILSGHIFETVLYLNGFNSKLVVMLLGCGLFVFPFIYHYMEPPYRLGLFTLLLCFWVIMGILLVCKISVATLLMWEYLGMTSFFLISYARTRYSCRSSLITAATARFGDVALMSLICFLWRVDNSFAVPCFIVYLAVSTKSALYPFLNWLIEAMRAPGPVSCLVHSSTLVIAGVWLSSQLVTTTQLSVTGLINSMTGYAVFTAFITSLIGLLLQDVKNVIALSTCNNMAWGLVCLCFGAYECCVVLIISHGLMKCLLFVYYGEVFKSSGHSQSGLNLSKAGTSNSFGAATGVLLLLGICGLPFIGLSYIKHVFLDTIFISYSLILYFHCILSMIMTFSTGVRLIYVILSPRIGLCSTLIYSLLTGSICGMVIPLVVGILSNYLHIDGVSYYPDSSYWWGSTSFIIIVGWILGLVSFYTTSLFYSISYPLSNFSCTDLINITMAMSGRISVAILDFVAYRWEVLAAGQVKYHSYLGKQRLKSFTNRGRFSFRGFILVLVIIVVVFYSDGSEVSL